MPCRDTTAMMPSSSSSMPNADNSFVRTVRRIYDLLRDCQPCVRSTGGCADSAILALGSRRLMVVSVTGNHAQRHGPVSIRCNDAGHALRGAPGDFLTKT